VVGIKIHTDQWNRTENPEINPHELIVTKGAKTFRCRKEASSVNGDGRTGYLYTREGSWNLTIYKISHKMDQTQNLVAKLSQMYWYIYLIFLLSFYCL
jgi:hypothetical protein